MLEVPAKVGFGFKIKPRNCFVTFYIYILVQGKINLSTAHNNFSHMLGYFKTVLFSFFFNPSII